MVKAAENTPEALLTALKAGHHYSSTGPDIQNITWDEKTVTVECSPASAIILQGAGTSTVAELGDGLTTATLKLAKLSGSDWLRITIIDASGKRAWSNPHWR